MKKVRWKSFGKKTGAAFLAAVFLAAACSQASISFAEELTGGAIGTGAGMDMGTGTDADAGIGTGAGVSDGGTAQESGPAIGTGASIDGSLEPPTEPLYVLTADRESVGFGTVFEGDTVKSQAIRLQNQGTGGVSLCWNETDPERAFVVDSTGDYEIPAGGAMDFYVAPRDGLETGNYSCTLLFGDSSDPGYARGVTVTVTVTVAPRQPYITGIQITPSSVSIAKGNTYGFQAQVSGENNPDLSVSWSVAGQKSGGTSISPDGVLTVAKEEQADSLIVKAASKADASVSATANVVLTGENYNVSVSAKPAEGGKVTGGGSVKEGDSMTVTASANNGYSFSGWTLNGAFVSGGNTCKLTDIRENMNLTANFTKNAVKVTVDADHSRAGTVTGGGMIAVGGSAGISARANEGYTFDGWEENGKIISKEANVQLHNIQGDRHLTARFSKEKYHVKLVSNPDRAGALTGDGSYKSGKDVSVKAEAGNGYKFVSWTKHGKVIGQKAELVIKDIDEDYCLTANFTKEKAKTYEITAGIAGSGGVISPGGATKIEEGSHITYAIAPQKGYRILAVAVDDVQVGALAAYTFTDVKANHKIVAAFEPKESAQAGQPSGGQPENTGGQQPDVSVGKADTAGTNASGTSGGEGHVYDASKEPAYEAPQMDMNMDNIADTGENPDLDGLTGILQAQNLTAEEARSLLKDGDPQGLLAQAAAEDYLQIAVNNQFAIKNQETVSLEGLENPTINNMEEMLNTVLTEDEKLKALEGNTVSINLDISDATEFISGEDKAVIDKAKGKDKKVGRYFDIVFLKTVDGNTEQITKLKSMLELVIRVPDDIKKEGRQYQILRIHDEADGSYAAAEIPDIDDNPDTITFRTDRFSAYAILYDGDGKETMAVFEWIVIAAGVLFLVAAGVLFIRRAGTIKKKRRHRKKQ